MKFADVLASSVHDIKNALGVMINTLDEITSDPDSGLAHNPKMLTLQSEAKRASNDLIQLLSLYKIENERLTPHVAEYNLEDFLDDILVEHRALAQARGIKINRECDPFLSAYFYADLVRGILNNAIGNAERYTRDRILLAADFQDDFLVIRVEDNGRGFPPAMLEMLDALNVSRGFQSGRTQLGLFFSSQVARMHQNQGLEGRIELGNECSLGGGCFSVCLP